jgi:hypothetical protein
MKQMIQKNIILLALTLSSCTFLEGSNVSDVAPSNKSATPATITPAVLTWIRQVGTGSFGNAMPGGNTTGYSFCKAVVTDVSGNVYCAGTTNSSLGELNGASIGVSSDVILMKFDPMGNLLWIKQAGSGSFGLSTGGDTTLDENFTSIALDSLGNIYCSGVTNGSLGETNGGDMDLVIFKFNPSGDLIWVKQAGAGAFGALMPGGNTSGADNCNITIDNLDNIYCVGSTTGSLGEVNAGLSDLFVLKLDTSGNVIWVWQAGAGVFGASLPGGDRAKNDFAYATAVDSLGNVVVAGGTFGSLGETYAALNREDSFLMKLDSNGNLLWIKQAGSGSFGLSMPGGNTAPMDRCTSVVVDSANNVICAGFTSGALGEATSVTYRDLFLMKLDSNGNLLWIKQAGVGSFGLSMPGGDTSRDDGCLSLAIDSTDHLYCGGWTAGSLGEANGGSSNYDLFILKLDSSGNVLWVKQAGSGSFGATFPGGSTAGMDECANIYVDASGYIYCGGNTTGSLGEPAIPANYNLYVMKLNASGSF